MEEIQLRAQIENIPVITEFIDSKLEELDCMPKAQMQIDIALDEILSNIARYAYTDQEGMMSVQLKYDEDTFQVVLTFRDNGEPFNPLIREDPDVTLSVEERDIGGLGIYLVKKTMDDVIYEHTNGQNILKIYKKIR